MTDRPGFPEPSPELLEPGELALRHLEHLRGAAVAKLVALPEAALRRSQVPSGWTPLTLAWHLRCMERRWIAWGFLGEALADPWADHGPDDVWRVPDGVTLDQVVASLAEQGALTRAVVSAHDWDAQAAAGGRFADDHRPRLGSICLHLVQEYARHLGHLDVVVELAGGDVGE